MKLRLPELQESNSKIKKIKKDLHKSWQDIEDVFYYQSFSYITKIIYPKIISYHHNNWLAGHFGIKKSRELVAKEYF